MCYSHTIPFITLPDMLWHHWWRLVATNSVQATLPHSHIPANLPPKLWLCTWYPIPPQIARAWEGLILLCLCIFHCEGREKNLTAYSTTNDGASEVDLVFPSIPPPPPPRQTKRGESTGPGNPLSRVNTLDRILRITHVQLIIYHQCHRWSLLAITFAFMCFCAVLTLAALQGRNWHCIECSVY